MSIQGTRRQRNSIGRGLLIAIALFAGACGSEEEGSDVETSPTVESVPVSTLPMAEDLPTDPPPTPSQPPATEAATATDEPTALPASPTPLPPTAAASTEAPAPALLSYDPDPNVDANCDDFPTREEAIAWWIVHRGEGHENPGGLDGDGDGEVCEQGSSGGSDAAPPPPPEPAAPAIACSGHRTCGTFSTQGEAQAYWEACGRPGSMDRDDDGVVCESLP